MTAPAAERLYDLAASGWLRSFSNDSFPSLTFHLLTLDAVELWCEALRRYEEPTSVPMSTRDIKHNPMCGSWKAECAIRCGLRREARKVQLIICSNKIQG